ncbi:hypothetical protein [Nocardioides sp. GXQ0305]|uniref:hypothetical protein n=1 Tax=Nocardioides sp. GXQ0305 TaxID=3423912 RepID=UPI003D7CAF6A
MFTRLLGDLPGSQLRMGGQATWTLTVHRPIPDGSRIRAVGTTRRPDPTGVPAP